MEIETFFMPAVTWIKSIFSNWSFLIRGEKYSERLSGFLFVLDAILDSALDKDSDINFWVSGPNFDVVDLRLAFKISF